METTISKRNTIVVYWPTTRPGCQNRKCTYVNNRCIRSRNIRIITLIVDGLNECNCDAHKKWALNCCITQWRQDVRQFGDQTRWWQDVVEKASTQQSGPSGPRLSCPRERERNAVMANRVRVNMLQFCSVSNSLSHTPLSNKVRGIFF